MPENAAASSFNLDGEVEMGFFSGQDDPIQVRINGERIEKVIARMFGFPSDTELQAALDAGISPDSSLPDVVRTMRSVSVSVYANES